ncbi:uncharacterized protein LOC142329266 isoform X3 [Lycorma delicatula]|uniref:uncharacterized protein LOC142329266 isoform X3 n=1 Tax=Lycorma delicatula TaxID=130591 RepID=UPI003F51506F
MNNPHELIHDNITLLSFIVPFNPGLENVFRKGMFAVPNKMGFNEVVYYLLNIIYPAKCKETLVWPCLSRKDEMKFRSDVAKFIAFINEITEHNLVTPLNSSLMLAPGGPQVVNFVWRLSLYALMVITKRKYGIEIPYIDQTSLHPLIIKARIKAVFLMPFYFNVDSIISQLDEHRQYVSYMLKLSRKLHQDLLKIEKERKDAELHLKKLIEEKDIDQHLKRRLNSDEIDDALKEWTSQLNTNAINFEKTITEISGFEKKIDYNYQLMKSIIDPRERIKLDGKKLNVTLPSSINMQLLLYKNNDLIIENLFQVACKVAEILEQGFITSNISDVSIHLPFLRAVKSDMSLNFSHFSHVKLDLSQVYSDTLQSFSTCRYLTECITDSNSMLNKAAECIQSPQLNFNNDNKQLQIIPYAEREDDKSLFQWLIQKNKENKVVNKITPEKLISFIKMPKKIDFCMSPQKNEKYDKFNALKYENLKLKEIPNSSANSKMHSRIPTSLEKESHQLKKSGKKIMYDEREGLSDKTIRNNKTTKTLQSNLHQPKKISKENVTPQKTEKLYCQPYNKSSKCVRNLEKSDSLLKKNSNCHILPKKLRKPNETLPVTSVYASASASTSLSDE